MVDMLESEPESSENKENHRTELIIHIGKPDNTETKNLRDLTVLLRAFIPACKNWEPRDLCDGKIFAELLHEIDNKFFDESWLDYFVALDSDSGAKRRNLRILWQKISQYLIEIGRGFGMSVSGSKWSNFDKWIDSDADAQVALDFGVLITTLAFIGPNMEYYKNCTEYLYEENPAEMANVINMIQVMICDLPEDNRHHEIGEELSEHSVSLIDIVDVTDTAEDMLEALRNERDNLLIKMEEFETLEKMNAKLKVSRRHAEEKVHELEAELEQLRPLYKHAVAEVDELVAARRELQGVRIELVNAREEVEVFRTTVDRLTIEASGLKARESEVKKLQAEVKALNAQIEGLKRKAVVTDVKEQELVDLHIQIGTLKADISTFEANFVANTAKIADLQAEIEFLKEVIETLEKEKKELAAERDALAEEISQEATTPRSLHESLIDADKYSFKFFHDNMVLPEERINDLETQNADYERLIKELEEQKKKNEEEIAEHRLEKQEMQLELTRREERILETEQVQRSFRVQAGAESDSKESSWVAIFSIILCFILVIFFLSLTAYYNISAPPIA